MKWAYNGYEVKLGKLFVSPFKNALQGYIIYLGIQTHALYTNIYTPTDG